jgi:zinc transporter ZupT
MTTLGILISHGIAIFMPNSHLLEKPKKKKKKGNSYEQQDLYVLVIVDLT